ncbi:MAG: hypothetical protein P4L10_03400 [Acidobacteriaceae bacterium]|nr:hypothetical protein [Acidobacteriaceae bacterium]
MRRNNGFFFASVHAAQLQKKAGTPAAAPVPRKRNLIPASKLVDLLSLG